MKRFLPIVLLASGCHFLTDPESVPEPAPSGLTYSTNPAIYVVGQPILDNVPSAGGGPVDAFEVAPALPEGLSLNALTGVISGTPAAVSPPTTYVVTATNPGGSTTVMLTIRVNDSVDVAPSDCSYPTDPAVYTNGVAIADNTPGCSGGGPVVSWAISPPLPADLSFNTSTGVISGTPNAIQTAILYTITATNSGGSTPFTLTITINEQPPTNLTYSENPVVYVRDQLITPNTPTNMGGFVDSYSVDKPLPGGLGIDSVSGYITGTPYIDTPTDIYTVTASNSAGSTTAGLSIRVFCPTVCTVKIVDPASARPGGQLRGN